MSAQEKTAGRAFAPQPLGVSRGHRGPGYGRMHVYQLSAHLCVVHQNAYVGAVCLHQRHHGGGARIRRFQRPDHGNVVEATRTRWGKFKPWIAIGGVLSVIVFITSFSTTLQGWAYVAAFGLLYFAIQRRIYNERHRLLGHGAGAGAPRRRPPTVLPPARCCLRAWGSFWAASLYPRLRRAAL